MKRKNTTIVLTLIVNFILSFFGVFVYRDADVPKYCNYWQCIYLSGYTMLSILFVVGALYVLMVYIFSEKGARLSCCIHPVIEILSLLGLQEPFKEICFYTFGHDNGEFSLWGWLMAITAISLFFQLFAASCSDSEAEAKNSSSDTSDETAVKIKKNVDLTKK